MAGRSGPWGFHELGRPSAARLVALAAVGPGDLVLDVGAGTGVITAELVRAGASVVAIELHPRRVDVLRRRFDGQRVRVMHADAANLRLPRRPFTVVANPPFGITTALLRRLTRPSSALVRGAIVLPAWASTRWAAGRGVGGAASKRRFLYAAGPTVPVRAFRQPPPHPPRIILISRAQ